MIRIFFGVIISLIILGCNENSLNSVNDSDTVNVGNKGIIISKIDSIQFDYQPTDIAMNYNGTLLAIARFDILLFELNSLNKILEIDRDSLYLQSLSFHPTENKLLICGDSQYDKNPTIRLYDLDSNKLLKELGNPLNKVEASCFHPSGNYFATGIKNNGGIKIWDATNYSVVQTIDYGGRIVSLKYSPNGDLLASLSLEYGFNLWNTKLQNQLHAQIPDINFNKINGEKWIHQIKFNGEGTYIATGFKNTLSLYELNNSSTNLIFTDNVISGTVEFHPLLNILVYYRTVNEDLKYGFGRLVFLDINSKEVIKEIVINSSTMDYILFNPDGDKLITCGDDGVYSSRKVIIWNFENNE